MALLPFPFGALNTALSLLVMHGISVTMFRSFLNQTLPSMEASSSGNKYQITLNKPAAKISNFIPEEIKFIQQQLNNRNKNIMELQQIRSQYNPNNTSSQQVTNPSLSSQNQLSAQSIQSILPQLQNSASLNPIASPSNIIQQIAQIRQQPFSGTISLHNQAKNSLSDITNQINNNQLNKLPYSNSILSQNLISNENQVNLINDPAKHISTMNLPFTTAGLNPNSKPKIVHIHHHDNFENQPSSLIYPNSLTEQSSYQKLNMFESSIPAGSLVSFHSVLSKRQGLTPNQIEPVIKEIPLNKITKFLERKKKKETKTHKNDAIRIVCTYVFDEFSKNVLDPKLIGDESFCSHLNVNSLIIKQNYQVGFQNQYLDTQRLNELMKIKNKNKNLKFILSIGEVSDAKTYDTLCSSSQLTSQFIDSIVDIIQLYGVDGINFNFKFDLKDPDSNLSFLFKQNLIQMLRTFRDELNRIGKHLFIVSALLPNSPEIIEAYFDLKELNSLLDFVNVIGYEFHQYKKDNPITAHHSALYANKDDNLAWLIKNWLNTELDKSKLNIGLSTFGRTYNVAYNNIKSLYNPLIGYGINNGTITYSDVCKFLLKNETIYVYNEKHQVPFTYNGYDLITFENEKSLSVKTKYISKLKIGGVMLFALNYDDINGECEKDNLDDNKFPLHKVVFKTMQIASLIESKRLR